MKSASFSVKGYALKATLFYPQIIKENNPAASVIIKATIQKKLIKESERPKEYVPIWA